MTDRALFERLQERWVSGDRLSPEEEQARVALAATDPLALRELELFRALRAHLQVAGDDSPNVAAALARARGVKLRVVLPGEGAAASRRAGPNWRAAAAVAAVLAVAAGVVVAMRRSGPDPSARAPAVKSQAVPVVAAPPARSELVFASGEVRLGGERAEVGGATLARGAKVTTGDGRACLGVDPGIDVCLAPNSEVLLDSLEPSDIRVRVALGTAVASLAPRSAGHTFSLVAGDVAATAHGTVFALEVGGGEPSRVTVLEGRVAVKRPGAAPSVLEMHGSLALRGAEAPLLDVAGRGEEARLLAWLAPRELARGANVGVLEVLEQGGRRVLVDEQGPYALPLRTFVKAGKHRIGLRPAVGADAVVEADVEAGAVRRVTAEATRAPEADTPSARALLAQARERLTRGDTPGARGLYERLRQLHPSSPEAHTVLVSLGKLELEGGAPERALALFDAYAKGGGPLQPEALSGRIRALRALGRSAEERQAIERYLASYPRSFEAAGLHKRLGSLSSP